MKRPTLSDIEYARRKRKTKREEFLHIMNEIIPWDEWVAYIVPYYPSGKRGRPPMGIEKMLRMYLLQCWFSLSDEGLGRGRWMDNVMIERLWRSVKWECLYLREVETGSQARKILRDWFQFYNEQRPHTAFDGRRPMEVYCERNPTSKAA